MEFHLCAFSISTMLFPLAFFLLFDIRITVCALWLHVWNSLTIFQLVLLTTNQSMLLSRLFSLDISNWDELILRIYLVAFLFGFNCFVGNADVEFGNWTIVSFWKLMILFWCVSKAICEMDLYLLAIVPGGTDAVVIPSRMPVLDQMDRTLLPSHSLALCFCRLHGRQFHSIFPSFAIRPTVILAFGSVVSDLDS